MSHTIVERTWIRTWSVSKLWSKQYIHQAIRFKVLSIMRVKTGSIWTQYGHFRRLVHCYVLRKQIQATWSYSKQSTWSPWKWSLHNLDGRMRTSMGLGTLRIMFKLNKTQPTMFFKMAFKLSLIKNSRVLPTHTTRNTNCKHQYSGKRAFHFKSPLIVNSYFLVLCIITAKVTSVIRSGRKGKNRLP